MDNQATTQAGTNPLIIKNAGVSAISEAKFCRENIEISEKPLTHIYQLMIFPQYHSEIKTQVKELTGIDLPKIGAISTNQSVKCFASQPNKWLFMADNDKDNSLNALISLCDNVKAAYVDLSSAMVAIKVDGNAATEFLQQLCFVDLSKDFATLTTQLASDYTATIEKLSFDSYVIYITRSLAKSLWDYLKVV